MTDLNFKANEISLDYVREPRADNPLFVFEYFDKYLPVGLPKSYVTNSWKNSFMFQVNNYCTSGSP